MVDERFPDGDAPSASGTVRAAVARGSIPQSRLLIRLERRMEVCWVRVHDGVDDRVVVIAGELDVASAFPGRRRVAPGSGCDRGRAGHELCGCRGPGRVDSVAAG